MKRIAFYGGSFDPVHHGHLSISEAVKNQFSLDEFAFVPAFQAPHKRRRAPTSSYDRYAMLCLATNNRSDVSVSRIEIELPEKPFTVETLSRLNDKLTDSEIFFVMGADSWMEIDTWREWETVLSLSNHIVVTRPGVDISFGHLTDGIRERIVDLRCTTAGEVKKQIDSVRGKKQIFVTDVVNLDISATEIRRQFRDDDPNWRRQLPEEVANYVEKYQIYK
jgi:nicotinate-nucleotide adenylyltransferase